MSDSQFRLKRHVSCSQLSLAAFSSGRATANAGAVGMGSVIVARYMALKSKYEILVLGVVGLSEGLEDAAQPTHDGGPHVLVGLLVGDEVNGALRAKCLSMASQAAPGSVT